MQIEKFLESILTVLRHVKDVQEDITCLSESAMQALVDDYKKQNIQLSTEAAGALQLQDIISQQISAVVEAIDSIDKSISVYIHALKHDNEMLDDSFFKLHSRLINSIEEAQKKKEEYSGNSDKKNDSSSGDIKFFDE